MLMAKNLLNALKCSALKTPHLQSLWPVFRTWIQHLAVTDQWRKVNYWPTELPKWHITESWPLSLALSSVIELVKEQNYGLRISFNAIWFSFTIKWAAKSGYSYWADARGWVPHLKMFTNQHYHVLREVLFRANDILCPQCSQSKNCLSCRNRLNYNT